MNKDIDKTYNVNIRLSQFIVINHSFITDAKEFVKNKDYAAIGALYKHKMRSVLDSIENNEYPNMITKAFRELMFEVNATDEDIGRFICECLNEI